MTATLKLWLSTLQATVTNAGTLLVFAVIYALVLAGSYVFISTREATVGQVILTYTLMILIPAGFFILQAAIIDRVRDQRFDWRTILIDAFKFFIIALPLLLVAWVIYYLLGKVAARYPAPIVPVLPVPNAPHKSPPLHWPALVFATLRFFLMGIALPLAAIHLWIAFAGRGIRPLLATGAAPVLRRVGRALGAAFATESALIYSSGLIIFFVLPYAVLWVPFSPKGNKTDFAVFVVRLILAFTFSLLGWVVTLSALIRNAPDAPPELSSPAVELPAEAAA